MTVTITVTDIAQPVVVGDDWSVVGTLTANGSTLNLTGATVTCSIHDERDMANPLQSAHAVTITTAASGIVTLTLTAAQSATLHADSLSPSRGVYHSADFKVVASGGAITHTDPWRLLVRRKVTA